MKIYKNSINKYKLYKSVIKNTFYYRPFFVKRIAHSNLLLVVVKNAESSHSNLSVNPIKVIYNNTLGTNYSCNKLNLNSFYRRKLGGCYNSHPEVIKNYLINHITYIYKFVIQLIFVFIGTKH